MMIGELDKAIQLLGRAWKSLLSHSNEELKMDEEFTRRGIELMLSKFEEEVSREHGIHYTFPWH
jgi:hypothetical protein